MTTDPLTNSFIIVVSTLLASLITWYIVRRGQHAAIGTAEANARNQSIAELSQLKEQTRNDTVRLSEQAKEIANTKQALDGMRQDRDDLKQQVATLSERLQGKEDSSQLLETAKTLLSEQFKSVATDLFDDKSKKNKEDLTQLLTPLKDQIEGFKKKVENTYDQENRDRSKIVEQISNLMSLNQTLSQEAKNLTSALKGEVKTQGNWGEFILERVLEASGLRKGEEYVAQDTQTREDGTRAQPDIIIKLPGSRTLVVDSKVSLNAYESYTTAETEEQRKSATRSHLSSIRNHLLGLSLKEYQKLYDGLDFVIMFVPIEPAFMLAISSDDKLFMDAWDRNVLLVSPSTLLFVVRTVAHLWRQEQQNLNAKQIAKRGAELYNRLRDFVADLEQIGTQLQSAQKTYDQAHKRLATGRGNVIRQAEMLKELGVRPSKQLPQALVDEASTDISVEEELTSLENSTQAP